MTPERRAASVRPDRPVELERSRDLKPDGSAAGTAEGAAAPEIDRRDRRSVRRAAGNRPATVRAALAAVTAARSSDVADKVASSRAQAGAEAARIAVDGRARMDGYGRRSKEHGSFQRGTAEQLDVAEVEGFISLE